MLNWDQIGTVDAIIMLSLDDIVFETHKFHVSVAASYDYATCLRLAKRLDRPMRDSSSPLIELMYSSCTVKEKCSRMLESPRE